MAVDPAKYQPGAEAQEEVLNLEPDFEARMLRRVCEDFTGASAYRDDLNKVIKLHEQQYHNARYYAELRKVNAFPVPIGQQLTDQLIATMIDKIAFAGRPCRVLGVEESDKADAEAKQAFMDWQDYRDDVETKIQQGGFDSALRRNAVAQVDYRKIERQIEVLEDVDVPVEMHPIIAAARQFIGAGPKMETQQAWVKKTIIEYMGAVVKMVNPKSVYYGPDKREMADPFPIMLCDYKAKEYFYSEKYFINQDKIDETPGRGKVPTASFKSEMLGEEVPASPSDEGYQYIEWQGVVDKADLYAYEGKEYDPEDPEKYCWAICGVVNQEVVVRLESQPHGLNGPNLVMGCIRCDGSVFRAISIMDLIYAICRGADDAMGQLITNIVSNIDSSWGIDETGLTDLAAIEKVNERALVYKCKRDPRTVLYRLDQVPQTEVLNRLVAAYYQMAKDAAGISSMALGQGDPNAETLGESAMVEGPSRLGIDAYLKTFERTFIKPLYEMRNQINANFVDLEFRFQVLGDKAVEWKTIDPAQVRANVDFVCEASSRESNRTVQVQQAMNYLKVVVPLIQANGGVVRPEEIGKYIAETGMTVSPETVEKWFPILKLEKDRGIDIGTMMAEAQLATMGIKLDMIGKVGGAVAPRPNISGGTTPGEVQTGVDQENNVNIGQNV